MAVWRRGKPDALLHHSDQGSPIHQRAVPAVDGRQRHRLQAFFPDAISHFNKRWPEIEIALLDDFYGRDLARLARGDVDFAAIPFDQETEQFHFELLLKDSFMPIVPNGHKLASRKE